MNKRVALYARVSTAENRGIQDPEVQLSQLREYCKHRGFQIYKEYVDHLSGVDDNRPSLNALMDAARKKLISGVVVFRFDRFSRSVSMLVRTLDEFRELGIDFVSYSENIDTSTAMGRCFFTIISAFSAMELDALKMRVRAGLRKAVESGKTLGRRRIGFDIGKALELKKQGLGVRRIAKQVGVSYGTVYRYIKSVTKTSSTESPQKR